MIIEITLATAFVSIAVSHLHLLRKLKQEKIALQTSFQTALTTLAGTLEDKLVKLLLSKNEVLVKAHKSALDSAYTALKAEVKSESEAKISALKSEVKSEYEANVAKLESSVKDIAVVIKQGDKRAFADAHQRVEDLAKSR